MRISDPVDLWRAYKETPSIALRNELMTIYYPLVSFVAKRLATRLPRFVEVDDLVGDGVFGLCDAIDKFDPTVGVKFKTYAMSRIRGAILDELRQHDWVPRLVRIKASRVAHAQEELEGELGRRPTFVETAERLNLSFAELQQEVDGATATAIISLSDETVNDDGKEGGSAIEMIADYRSGADPVEAVSSKEQFAALIDAVALNDAQRTVLSLYLKHELDMKTIASLLDLTESRISQIYGCALEEIRRAIEGECAHDE